MFIRQTLANNVRHTIRDAFAVMLKLWSVDLLRSVRILSRCNYCEILKYSRNTRKTHKDALCSQCFLTVHSWGHVVATTEEDNCDNYGAVMALRKRNCCILYLLFHLVPWSQVSVTSGTTDGTKSNFFIIHSRPILFHPQILVSN